MGMIVTLQYLLHILQIHFWHPTYSVLDRTPSIKAGIINDADIPGGVKLTLFHTRCHPQLVTPWVEICLHNTYLVRRH